MAWPRISRQSRLEDVTALKTGQGVPRLRFFNAFYAGGVQDNEKTLRVLRRQPEYIVCDILHEGDVRVAIITACTLEFLIKHADPAYVEEHRMALLNSDPQTRLDSSIASLEPSETLHPFHTATASIGSLRFMGCIYSHNVL